MSSSNKLSKILKLICLRKSVEKLMKKIGKRDRSLNKS